LLYADVLRALATVAVIMLHVASGYVYEFPTLPRDQWWPAHFYDSATRWCVPIFIMLSGSLLLRPTPLTPEQFLWRRGTRVLIPFLVWNAVYLGIEYGTFISNNGYVPWQDVLKKVLSGQVKYHLWFVYLILALYLITPVLRTFVQHVTKTGLRYYLWLWVILNFLGLLLRLLKMFEILPEDTRVASYMELTGYAGYFILGWAMSVNAITFSPKALAGLLMAGFLLAFQGTFELTRYNGGFVEILFEYLQPAVMMMSVGVFGLVQRAYSASGRQPSGAVAHLLAAFTQLSFGIYLMHILVLDQLHSGMLFGKPINGLTFLGYPLHPVLGIPICTISILVICFALMKLLSFVPKLRDWVM
jgi:surface polysaccharide O-acyltransferase-like enzyme